MYTILHRHKIFLALWLCSCLHPIYGASSHKKNKKNLSHKIQTKKEIKLEKKNIPPTPLLLPLKQRIKDVLQHENIFIAGGIVTLSTVLIFFSKSNHATNPDPKTETFQAQAACPLCLDSVEELEQANKKLLSLPCHEKHQICNECLPMIPTNNSERLCPMCREAIPDFFFEKQQLGKSLKDVNEDTNGGRDSATHELIHDLMRGEDEGEGFLQYM